MDGHLDFDFGGCLKCRAIKSYKSNPTPCAEIGSSVILLSVLSSKIEKQQVAIA